METCYLLSIFRGNLLEEQMTIMPYGNKLLTSGCDGKPPGVVSCDSKNRELVIGSFGRFIRDHQAGEAYRESGANLSGWEAFEPEQMERLINE